MNEWDVQSRSGSQWQSWDFHHSWYLCAPDWSQPCGQSQDHGGPALLEVERRPVDSQFSAPPSAPRRS